MLDWFGRTYALVLSRQGAALVDIAVCRRADASSSPPTPVSDWRQAS